MAGSSTYTVGTAPTVLVSAPRSAYPGPVGWFVMTNGGTAPVILAGGTNATTFAGPSVTAGGTLTGELFSGDTVYGATTAGSATSFGVLQTGA